ncbi:NXPE family member 3-like [Lytechinus variegatus]|uniref:NXPE family member 3-like n=1 Tax=Lytechinus variegatus TaxID=7654 RepID=UPI001BB0D8E9|nr:NXPE family member 3-like [Lytechinus variegatus]
MCKTFQWKQLSRYSEMKRYTQYCFLFLSAIIGIIGYEWFWGNQEFRILDRLREIKPRPNGTMAISNQFNTWSVGNETLRHHPLCPNQKRRHFPHFSYPPATPRQWVTSMDTTNASFSRFTIVNPKEIYAVCDQLELLIEARNGYNESKTYGGDLFRAKIFTQNSSFTASSGSDGEVIDLGNGKYSAFFTLKWSGNVRINVTLALPSEAVFELQNLRDTLQPRETYLGKFSKGLGGKHIEENVECGHVPVDHSISKCNLSDPSVGLTWFCQRPKSDMLSCEDWTQFKVQEWRFNKKIEDQGFSKRTSVVLRLFAPITGLPSHVTVTSQSDTLLKERIARLPSCGQQRDRFQDIPWVAGFYQNRRWFPPLCRVSPIFLDKDWCVKCMTGKHFYFFGDSTIRQVYTKMTHFLVGSHREGHWVDRDETHIAQHDIHLVYNFHHIPIRNFQWHKLERLQFVTKELDSIRSNEKAIVVICLWSHFQPLYKSFYEQRITAIAKAARRLLNRNPQAIVIFKGGNTQNNYGARTQYLNDHYARDNEEALRRILKSYPEFHFLDAWDMSKGQLALANTHPPEPHLSNLANQILTIACPD